MPFDKDIADYMLDVIFRLFDERSLEYLKPLTDLMTISETLSILFSYQTTTEVILKLLLIKKRKNYFFLTIYIINGKIIIYIMEYILYGAKNK